MLAPRKISRKLAFIPLQDVSGTVQLVVTDPELVDAMSSVPVESVVCVHGSVQGRSHGAVNEAMRTGAIEVRVDAWELLNAAAPKLPFYPTQCHDAASLPNEALRAKHRYLDLRRPALASHIRERSRIMHAARSFLHECDFTEVETPILLRSTPEGAREFLVPTRGTQPQFYALQQSPQQPKQLLMVSGVTDRYYQFAKCFRDEDGRKDRQPEFTQIDMEMSFVTGRGDEPAWPLGGTEVRRVTEGLVRAMWDASSATTTLPTPFPVLSYEHVMSVYGSDKPDTRFGLQIENLLPKGASEALDVLVVPHYTSCQLSARQKEALLQDKSGTGRLPIEHFKARRSAPQALAERLWTKSHHVRGWQPHWGCAEALGAVLHGVMERANAFRDAAPLPREDTCDVYVARRALPIQGGSTPMGDLRLRWAEALPLTCAEPQVLWVTQFPLFTRADDDKAEMAHGRWSASHHPFTAPLADDVPRLYQALACEDPTERDALLSTIHGQHYDLVLNGAEIGGGSVRIHDAHLQRTMLEQVLALTPHETARFDHLLRALASGAPPHAGLALGFDRFMAIVCDTSSIRDVIAFPKSGAGIDPLFSSPAPLDDAEQRTQLAIYSLQPRSSVVGRGSR